MITGGKIYPPMYVTAVDYHMIQRPLPREWYDKRLTRTRYKTEHAAFVYTINRDGTDGKTAYGDYAEALDQAETQAETDPRGTYGITIWICKRYSTQRRAYTGADKIITLPINDPTE